MIISIPCSKKVFNVWCTIIILACFCNKFPGPIIGIILLIIFAFLQLLRNLKLEKQTYNYIQNGLLPIETVGIIAIALTQNINKMNQVDFEIFKSQYTFFKTNVNNLFPQITNNKDNQNDVIQVLDYIGKQISFIKTQITEENNDILENQINAYLALLVSYYRILYKDIDIISFDLFNKLDK